MRLHSTDKAYAVKESDHTRAEKRRFGPEPKPVTISLCPLTEIPSLPTPAVALLLGPRCNAIRLRAFTAAVENVAGDRICWRPRESRLSTEGQLRAAS